MPRTGAAIFLLIVLGSSFAVTLAPKAAYGAVGQRDWWNAEWRARIPILIVNSANVSRVNEAAFVYLNLESLGLASALTELRVVDGGEEVPSWVIWEDRGESWVRGVYLFFLLNVKAGEEKVFQAYVSNPGVNVPSYRTGNASVPIKFPSISVGPVVAASTVSFGGTFSIGDLLMLRSDEWGLARYGAAEIGCLLYTSPSPRD